MDRRTSTLLINHRLTVCSQLALKWSPPIKRFKSSLCLGLNAKAQNWLKAITFLAAPLLSTIPDGTEECGRAMFTNDKKEWVEAVSTIKSLRSDFLLASQRHWPVKVEWVRKAAGQERETGERCVCDTASVTRINLIKRITAFRGRIACNRPGENACLRCRNAESFSCPVVSCAPGSVQNAISVL